MKIKIIIAVSFFMFCGCDNVLHKTINVSSIDNCLKKNNDTSDIKYKQHDDSKIASSIDDSSLNEDDREMLLGEYPVLPKINYESAIRLSDLNHKYKPGINIPDLKYKERLIHIYFKLNIESVENNFIKGKVSIKEIYFRNNEKLIGYEYIRDNDVLYQKVQQWLNDITYTTEDTISAGNYQILSAIVVNDSPKN